MVRRRVVVTGHVQGVFFRDSTRTEARRRGVTGWVRNLPDGSVEAELEGSDADVDIVVSWMGAGPDQAQVDDVQVSDVPETGERGFRVR
ncbi:MAG: acylphosphatase [Janthinobacterium lividum]